MMHDHQGTVGDTFVVTAPTGTVGSEVVRLLLEQTPHIPFRLASRHPLPLSQSGSPLSWNKFAFEDPYTWHKTVVSIRTLFLVCPQPTPRAVRTQVIPFLDAAINAGCQHIIFLSVPGADRVAFLPHARIERYIQASGVSYTFLRPAYFMQNLLRKAPTHGIDIATRQELFIPAGRGRLAMIDARNIAQVVIKVCAAPQQHQNCAYDLTGSEAPDLYEIAHTLSQVLGQEIRYTHPTLPHFWYRLRRRGVPWPLLFIMTIEYTLTQLGLSASTNPLLSQLIGRAPTLLAQFVKDYRQDWINQSWM